MELSLIRYPSRESTTLGELWMDGAHFCVTLEDQVRPDGEKIYGKTAIPAGKYRVDITYSPKFQKMMLAVEDVPGFTGIRIHSGNDAEDTLGCILVGAVVDSPTRIHGGSAVLPVLFDAVSAALALGESVSLVIA